MGKGSGFTMIYNDEVGEQVVVCFPSPETINFASYGIELTADVHKILSIGYKDGLGDHSLFSCIIVTLRDGKVYYGPLKNGSDALGDMRELSHKWERLGGGK